jgi:hypothetical protein
MKKKASIKYNKTREIKHGMFALLFIFSGIFIQAKTLAPINEPEDPNSTVQPSVLVGFGAATTGGRGGKFIRVTSLSDNSGTIGSIRWALNQYPGEPIYIALSVEGKINLGEVLNITRPNVTIDGRFAPGSGCWFVGQRIEVENDNIFLDHVAHYGNDPDVDSNSDCIRWGDYKETEDCDLGYVRNCEFYHGSDETFAFT